jgi:spermidine/putrescine transport system permease protein
MKESALWWRLLKFFTALVYAFLFAPILVVVILSFNTASFGSFPISGLSLKWFGRLWENEAIVGAFGTSLALGVLTATISTTVALCASMALCRHRIAARKSIGILMIAPLLVPETVLAVGLLLLLRTLDLPRTFGLLLAGHVLITLPFAALVIQAHLAGLGRAFEDAAASLGAKPLWVLVEVTLPLSLPAIIAALLFTFTISFDNLTASLFWRPPGMETVPTQVFAMLRDSISPQINALGTVMIIITLSVSLVAGVLSSITRRGRRAKQGQGESSSS